MLTKQGRGATSQNFGVAPERGGGGGSGGTPGSVGPRAPVGSPTPVGAERGPGLPAPGGRVSSAQLSPVGPPLPPGGRPRLWGRASRQATRAAPTRAAEMERSLLPPPLRACTPGPRGGHEGSRAGTPPGPEFSHRTGMPGRSAVAARGLGTKFIGARRGRRWGRGRPAVPAGRGTLAARRSKQAGPEAGPEPLPAPCAPPRPPLHTHSRVCLARERCPWLHNSPDGIRPSVFLNRAAKKVRVVCGQRLATLPPPIGGGGRIGADWGVRRPSLGCAWGGEHSGGLSLPRGRGGNWGWKDGIARFNHSGVPRNTSSANVHLALGVVF